MSDRGRNYMVPSDKMAYESQRDMRDYGPPSDGWQSYTDRHTGNYSTGHEPPADYFHRHSKQKESDDDSDDSLDVEEKKKSVYKLWGRFADKTAMQGCNYIYSSRMWYAKVLWVILLLGSIAGMVFHLTYLTNQYILFPKITKISLNFSNLPFPAVTFCNSNAIRLSQLNKTSREMQKLVAATKPDRFDPKNHQNAGGHPPNPPSPGKKKRRKKRFVDDFNKLDFANYTEYGEDYYEYYGGDHPPEKDEQAELEDTFRNLFMEMSRDKRIEVGHQIEDMLISCSFDGYKCYAENFTVVSNDDFGNCFTLSSKYMTTRPGPKSGLSIILYMELEEYLEGISQGYGIRAVVHERKSFPFPADRGIYLSPSFESHIGLKLTNISREGDPYGKCNDGVSYSQQYGVKYTRMICQALCRQTETYRRCGCYDEDDEELFHFIHRIKKNFCRTKEQYKCMDKVNYEFDKKEISCTCDDPCYEQKYTLYPSYRVWPTDQYAVLLQEGVCDKLPPAKCKRIIEQTDPRTLSQNFLKFVIYYEDLNFEEFDEEPEIEDAQFVSDVGGAIGLWIGLSLLAIFEVFQFFFELSMFGCKVCCSKDNKKNQGKKKPKKEKKVPQNGGPVYNQSQISQWNKNSRNGEFDNINFSRPSPQNRWGYNY